MSTTRPVVVEFRRAVKRYGRVEAMRAMDLHIPAGRFVVLLGPSGSGKSTLVRCLAGVERLDDGELRMGGEVVADRRRHLPPERRHLGMVFQDYALWPHLTVADNVAYALRRLRPSRTEAGRRVMEMLERVGLAAHHGRYPHELSGGEQQRVALARAVVAEPGLLLFDEPLSNLDADLRERLRVQIATLSRETGATAVYITHDQAEAFALADDIGVLDQGRLVQFGRPEDVYHRPATPFVARFTGLAAEIPGRIVDRGPGPDEVEVEVDGGRFGARGHPEGRVGDRVVVAVRPAAARLGPVARVAELVPAVASNGQGRPAASHGSGTAGERAGRLAATVMDVAYRGRGYDHVLACAGQMLTGCHDTVRHDRGSRVTLTLDPAGCVAFPADQS
ncbi:MAG: ABC transporter ATP-binding protein [Actinomycetota bacterium]|nr:ABC transporter ATP-binding protein [Actinomycetota bacterium]